MAPNKGDPEKGSKKEKSSNEGNEDKMGKEKSSRSRKDKKSEKSSKSEKSKSSQHSQSSKNTKSSRVSDSTTKRDDTDDEFEAYVKELCGIPDLDPGLKILIGDILKDPQLPEAMRQEGGVYDYTSFIRICGTTDYGNMVVTFGMEYTVSNFTKLSMACFLA